MSTSQPWWSKLWILSSGVNGSIPELFNIINNLSFVLSKYDLAISSLELILFSAFSINIIVSITPSKSALYLEYS